MPQYKIYLNFAISDRLRDYIQTTYEANILSWNIARNMTAVRVQAPSQAALDAALTDIRSRLVEIQEYNP